MMIVVFKGIYVVVIVSQLCQVGAFLIASKLFNESYNAAK